MIGVKTLVPKNFCVEYNTRLQGFIAGVSKYFVSVDGKIKSGKNNCPFCGSRECVDNGYYCIEDSVITSLGLKIKIAQFRCKNCGAFWSSERDFIDDIIKKEKDFVKCLLIGAARQGLSFESATSLVKETVGHSYSPQYLHELYTAALDQVKQEKFCSASGVYNYDEQYLKENGNEVCRLTIKDTVDGKIILDKHTIDAQKETIRKEISKALEGLPVEAFILDMNRIYPELIHELYPRAKIQWCIFHLHKIIWKELREEFGKNIPPLQLYNVYTLFNTFFNHELELKKLEELLKKLDQYTGKAALPELNSSDFPSPLILRRGMETQSTRTRAAPQEAREIEHCLHQEFARFVKSLKKERRRNQQKIPRRTLEESQKIFTEIKKQVLLFPKKLQKRIQYIDDNWEKFTLFQRDSRVPPTNNGIEQYFAATLSKTDKKDFRSKNAITRELNACQAEWNGHKLFSTTKLTEVISMIGTLFLAFPPT